MSGGSITQVVVVGEVCLPATPDLEPYHRLIALPKEIIKLAEQNERARQDCRSLLEHVTTQGLAQNAAPRTFRQKVGQAFGQLPKVSAKSSLVTLVIKEQATC